MSYVGLAITGTSGSGKTALSRELAAHSRGLFKPVKAVTTRERRPDDQSGEYDYISREAFAALDRDGHLLVKAQYRDKLYGIRHSDVQLVSASGDIPVLVVTPSSVAEIQKHARYLSFFIDAKDQDLDRRLAERKERPTKAVVDQRLDDRRYEDNCAYSLINESLGTTAELIAELWDHSEGGGLLPADIIKLMMQCGYLIIGGDLDKVTGAAYDLSLGEEYYYGGKSHLLTDQSEFIKLEPHEYVLVRAKETVRMPKDVTARYGIRVGLFLQGLIESNGPQVDPGFEGILWCLLFNTSGDVVQLKRGDHYSTIEFSKLLSPTSAYRGPHQDKDKIMDYLYREASRSPIKQLRDDIAHIKAEGLLSKVLPTIIAGIIAAAALVVAILALINKK